jgi:hypothetical protein
VANPAFVRGEPSVDRVVAYTFFACRKKAAQSLGYSDQFEIVRPFSRRVESETLMIFPSIQPGALSDEEYKGLCARMGDPLAEALTDASLGSSTPTIIIIFVEC